MSLHRVKLTTNINHSTWYSGCLGWGLIEEYHGICVEDGQRVVHPRKKSKQRKRKWQTGVMGERVTSRERKMGSHGGRKTSDITDNQKLTTSIGTEKTAPSRMGRAPMPRVPPRALGVTFSRILPFPDSVSFFLTGSAPGYLPLEKTFHSCSLRRAWGVESNPGNSTQPLLNYNWPEFP